ncbi:MAG: hypothetical protein LBB89_11065 [Treponema sp.]|jgi:hypothetical protein|nr:hypothetical protein [Treponema sp.]
MSRGILIAGNKSALTNAIEIETARRVEHYAIALLPDRSRDSPQTGDTVKKGLLARGEDTSSKSSAVQDSAQESGIPLDWNPGSPISARTLVIAAENRFEHIDEAILVCDPPSVRYAAADISLADIEVLVNDHIKGWLFLVKELAAVFRAREKGTLALVYSETSGAGGKDDIVDLLGPVALAAFRSFTSGLLSASFNEPYLTLGFSGADTGDEAGFAAFIFKQLEEGNRRSNGKLYKYGKLGFFR